MKNSLQSLLLFYIFLLMSCNNSVTEYTNDTKVATIMRKYYPNGNEQEEVPFINDSTIQGYFKTFFENGTLKNVVQFKNGEKDGIEKHYYPSGKIKSELENKTGLTEGLAKYYWENGKVKNEYSFLNGKFFGKQMDYDSSGNLLLFEFINLNGDLIFKYTPLNKNFNSEGSPVYIAYKRDTLKAGEEVEVKYFFAVPSNFSYKSYYKLDGNPSVEISNTVDKKYYSYRYILREKIDEIGHHRVTFILDAKDPNMVKNITDTSFVDIEVIR